MTIKFEKERKVDDIPENQENDDTNQNVKLEKSVSEVIAEELDSKVVKISKNSILLNLFSIETKL